MSIDLPGFVDPVMGAQEAFRAVLGALSQPGSIHRAGLSLTPPAPLHQATAAVLLTLVDFDTALYLDPACTAARDWAAFHCGAPLAAIQGSAAFVLALTWPDFAQLDAGTDDAPEDGATLILQVAGFDAGTFLTLTGPGLAAPTTLAVDGLPDDFVACWAANHARFPRGVDIILCAGDQLAALPRSLRITHAAAREV